jgi:hypothetical protein
VGEFDRRSQRMVALCMLGCVLFNFPLLALFNVPEMLFGVPLLYAYVFVVWGLLIALMGWVIEKRE